MIVAGCPLVATMPVVSPIASSRGEAGNGVVHRAKKAKRSRGAFMEVMREHSIAERTHPFVKTGTALRACPAAKEDFIESLRYPDTRENGSALGALGGLCQRLHVEAQLSLRPRMLDDEVAADDAAQHEERIDEVEDLVHR